MPPHDLIDVVETAYDLRSDDRTWLKNLLVAAAPYLDVGRGIVGMYYDASSSRHVRVWHPTDVGETTLPMKIRLGREVFLGRESQTAAWIARGPTTVGSMSDVLRQIGTLETIQPWINLSGHGDYLGIRACDGHHRGVAFAVCHAAPFSPSQSTCRRWSRIAAHIAAAYRLRRSLHVAEVDPLIDDGDAVLDASGRCHHAVSDAQDVRDELKRAVLEMDRARGSARKSDIETALSLWRGLVDGTWSLVERFDSDGRRFLIARRNEPGVLDPRGLSLREKQVVSFAAMGHSSKLIAYELGIEKSTVSSHLTAAMHKLGVDNHVALVRLLNHFGSPSEFEFQWSMEDEV
jgi:DNA-binding CsgD family transcriptional regulator